MITKVRVGSDLCTALMNCMEKLTPNQIDDWVSRKDDKGNLLLDVQFTVNGCEADFSNLLNLLLENYDELVEKRAKSLLKEHLDRICAKLYDIEEAVDQIHINEFHELVP